MKSFSLQNVRIKKRQSVFVVKYNTLEWTEIAIRNINVTYCSWQMLCVDLNVHTLPTYRLPSRHQYECVLCIGWSGCVCCKPTFRLSNSINEQCGLCQYVSMSVPLIWIGKVYVKNEMFSQSKQWRLVYNALYLGSWILIPAQKK